MIAIVTDSSAYLTRREAKAWGIVYVPLLYTIHSKEYAEKFADENQDITPVIRSGEAGHTSQAPQDSFLKVFRKLREQGYEVLCITMSSRLSGMYNNAWVCAQSLEDEGIEVVDSLATAGQVKLLLEQAQCILFFRWMTWHRCAEAAAWGRSSFRSAPFSISNPYCVCGKGRSAQSGQRRARGNGFAKS